MKQINYISLKRGLPSNKIEKVISAFIKVCREQNKPLWILSYKTKDSKGDIWFKGIQCLPNHLLQSTSWFQQVIPNDHFIIDLTNCISTVKLEGGITSIANPNNFYWSNSYDT